MLLKSPKKRLDAICKDSKCSHMLSSATLTIRNLSKNWSTCAMISCLSVNMKYSTFKMPMLIPMHLATSLVNPMEEVRIPINQCML